MNLTFSKLYLPKYESEDHVIYKRLHLYYIFETTHLLSHYFRQGSKHFFQLNEQAIKIVNTNKGLFRKPEYSIIDKDTGKIIGYFDIPSSYNSSYQHYPEAPYTSPNLKIFLNEIEYKFRREVPQVKSWLFDSNTWGYYKFCIYDGRMDCKVSYQMKSSSPVQFDELEGNIEVKSENYLLMFTGFFLLEYFFDFQNANN